MTDRLHFDWGFFALFIGLSLAWLPLYLLDINPRDVGWQLAAVAALGLMARLVGWFHETPAGMRVGGALLLLSVIVRAWAQRHVGDSLPITWATYAYISITAMCIAYAWYWPRWTESKTSLFLKQKA